MGKRNLKKVRDEIQSESDSALSDSQVPDSVESDDNTETPAQKRLRLAKQYLKSINYDEQTLQKNLPGARTNIDYFEQPLGEFVTVKRIKHRSSCISVCMFNDIMYSADQHGVYLHDIEGSTKISNEKYIYAMDISFDGKFLVSL